MARVLYFSYDGLLDPLGQSQVIPYLSLVVSAGNLLTVISYEKEQHSKEKIESLEKQLTQMGIRWKRLKFRSGKMWAIPRFFMGIGFIRRLCRQNHPHFIHLRGFVPVLIYKLSFIKRPYLYDFRGFALGEWVDIGKVAVGSPFHYILNLVDQSAVKNASGLVVLEKSAKRLLGEIYSVPDVPFKVIRTCTNVNRYKVREKLSAHGNDRSLRFVFLGGARSPYRADLALLLINGMLKNGLDCYLDFINIGDHLEIKKAIDFSGLSSDRVRVFGCDQGEIPDALTSYDCGIIMIETSQWRKVCSPTKLGEYLAAGLPVISLEGIDITDELSQRTCCVVNLSQSELETGFNQEKVNQILDLIRRKSVTHECQLLAREEFCMEKAGALYVELYAEIEKRITE